MAEKVILVCDVCSRPAATSVTFQVNGQAKKRVVDYCTEDLKDLMDISRPPKRGRRPGPQKQAGARSKARAPKPGPGTHDASEVPSAEEVAALMDDD